MAGQISPGKSKNVKTPKVTFRIEIRPATPEQKDAGRRLFSKLVDRARAVGAAGATACKEKMNK